MDFSGKVVVVTGGARGIGRAVSLAFARRGAKVAVLDVDEPACAAHLARLERAGAQALALCADVASEAQVRRAVQQTVETFGRIDVLINNAGIGGTRPLSRRPMEEWDRILAVNLRGPYMMVKYCAPYLAAAGPGAVVNIASTRALMSERDTEPYSASKGGLLALTHALAVSLGPGVRVNAVSPGWIDVTGWQGDGEAVPSSHRREDMEQHPVGRVGRPEDVAEACVFLSSPESGFITGANLVVDGGMTIRMVYAEDPGD